MGSRPFAPSGFRCGEVFSVGALATAFEVTRNAERYVCKRLSPRSFGEDAAQRLLGEGRILDVLGGRGAPELVAVGEDDHGPFLLMQQVTAPTLEAHMMHALDAAWIERATRAAFAALAAVHEARDARGPLGVVHADVSPANLAISADGTTAKLLDFGLARWRDGGPALRERDRDHDAAKGAVARDPRPFRGTLVYVAPELARGEAYDRRVDLFAMAASLLHAASGEPPREAAHPAALLAKAGEESIEAYARRASARLAPPVAAALVKCVAFEASKRPAKAREMVATPAG